MARSYKNPSIVSGRSISDILNMEIEDFNKLGVSDLRKVVGRLVSAGNKRIRSFERSGESSPAYRRVMNSGGVFSTRGKNLNELRSEFMRAKSFLEARTGTRKGWNETKRKTVQSLKEQGVEVDNEQFDDLWKAYEELAEVDPEVKSKRLKYAILVDISKMLDDPSIDANSIALELHSKLDTIYEQRMEEFNDVDGVSGFFEL